MAETEEPLQITVTRTEVRGEFPVHGDRVGRVIPLAEARKWARERLERWRQENGYGE